MISFRSNINKFLVTVFIGLTTNFATVLPTVANTQTIEAKNARDKSIPVAVIPGKASSINFKSDEIIIFVMLSDQSNNVYNLNAPVESGEARSVYLRQIQTLNIPGTTTTENPNLFVVTTDGQGNQFEYEFSLQNNSTDTDSYRIAIAPTSPPPKPKPKPKPIPQPQNTIQTRFGEATPFDIQLGLDTNIKKGQIPSDDPLVLAVREYIALTMNGTSTQGAIESVDLPLSILQKLATVGQVEDARRRILSLPPTLNLSESSNSSIAPTNLNTPQKSLKR